MPRARKKPSYCHHRPTGQAYCRIEGKMVYLGTWDTPESRTRYESELEGWALRQNPGSSTMTVDELVLRYLKHCEAYYRTPDGRDTGETSNVKAACRYVVRECGTVRVRDFGPLKLKRVREAMIQAGISRGYINAACGRIRRMFRWGVAEEMVPVAVPQALETVPGLRAGRTDAVEAKPVKPVPEAFVDAVRPHVSRQVWAMIQTQLFSGMRPGEVLIMRGCDLNTSGKVWEYTPSRHKTEHHGCRRIVFLGPRAQAIVREFLRPNLSEFLFSPADAEADRKASRRAARKTPVQPSQVNRRKREPKKKTGVRYTRVAYANSIRRACVKADVPHWHPHQLRHNAGTALRREVGLETARTILGHASADVTEIYAERDMAAAREAAAKLG